MSVIAWDGKMLAADKQATSQGLIVTTTKIRRVANGSIIAFEGDIDRGLVLAKWYEDGCDESKWPSFQKDKDDWTRLVLATTDGIFNYEREPIPIRIESSIMAWGQGRDFAIAAMHMGKNASEAVLFASKFTTGCGCGVNAFELNQSGKIRNIEGDVTATSEPCDPDYWLCIRCGCLWRDNHDLTISLGSAKQTSCEYCEHTTIRTSCIPLYRDKERKADQ